MNLPADGRSLCVVGLLLAGAAVVATACQKETGEGPAPAASGSAAPLTPELRSRVLARVGDRVITLGDYAATLEQMNQFERERYRTPTRRKALLDELINAELLAQEAQRRGLDKLPDTQEHIRQLLRDEALQAVRAKLPKLEDIPKGEVGAYYAAHTDDYTEPERRRLSAIVVTSRAVAEKVLAAARQASPEQWGVLVAKYSPSTDNPKGMPPAPELAGDLGFVSAPGEARGANSRVPDPVRKVGFEMKSPGDVFGSVVAANAKFYVVRLMAVNAPRKRTLAEAENTIRLKILQQRFDKAVKDLEKELRAKIPVKIDTEALAKLRLDEKEGGTAPGASAAMPAPSSAPSTPTPTPSTTAPAPSATP